MIGAVIMHPRQPGPCVICGGADYDLSCGGPTICPKFDCGNFDSATVMKQAKVIADLRKQIQTLTDPAQGAGMPWERAETAHIDFNAFYLVKDNGGEWRDFDLNIMRGQMVNHRLAPNYVRGRPEWIAKINSPSTLPSTQSGGGK